MISILVSLMVSKVLADLNVDKELSAKIIKGVMQEAIKLKTKKDE